MLVPGDPERNSTKKVDEEGGVLYHENQLKASVSKIVCAVRKVVKNPSYKLVDLTTRLIYLGFIRKLMLF